MLDCYSGGRIISGFVRGTAVETLQAGIAPPENRARFEEAHDLIIKCWTEPGPFRYEGQYYKYRAINPWVLPVQKPHPDIWFPGTGSPESVVWAAKHRHPYMNLGALVDTTEWLRQVYIDTAKEEGYQAGPEHFGYLLRCLVADTDEKAIEIGREFMWTIEHRQRGAHGAQRSARLPVQGGGPGEGPATHRQRRRRRRPGSGTQLRTAPGREQHHRRQPGDGHPASSPRSSSASARGTCISMAMKATWTTTT